MRKARLIFDFASYWHSGSGVGEGTNLDAVVNRTSAGLPYLPGRTVKGLVREAVQTAEDFSQVPPGATDKLFGGGAMDDRFGTVAGNLAFTNATLGKDMEHWATNPNNAAAMREFYQEIAATAIDQKGLAIDQSLRRTEVAIPCTLIAEIDGVDDDAIAILQKIAPLIREAGSHRHRGFGRVMVRVEEVEK